MEQVVVVTGAAKGIGLAIARCFGAAGWQAALLDIDGESVRQGSLSIPGSRAWQVDVSDYAAMDGVIGEVVGHIGLPQAIVNNAGVIHRSSVLETPPESFHQVVDTNLGGVFAGSRILATRWVEAGVGGHIVNISSGHAKIGGYNRSAYAASKAAIEAFTRNCAVELGQHGIYVNAVAPGFTFTEMSRNSLVGERLKMVEHRLPIRRVAEAEEVARAVVSLVEGRIPYMTGQVLQIDGGWSNSDVDYTRLMPEQD
ncbi:MAG: SDR family oxidoreductase [Armatimonadetes bacterium]|nr:SDR family oxidoreductase [Armatimonadota bacterium]